VNLSGVKAIISIVPMSQGKPDDGVTSPSDHVDKVTKSPDVDKKTTQQVRHTQIVHEFWILDISCIYMYTPLYAYMPIDISRTVNLAHL